MEERFTESHEWIRIDGNVATVGITKYAADQLGDVVFVDLPNAGKQLKSGAEAAVVESVKAASEIYARHLEIRVSQSCDKVTTTVRAVAVVRWRSESRFARPLHPRSVALSVFSSVGRGELPRFHLSASVRSPEP